MTSFNDTLDFLYKDIGKKIKNWAKWMFIIEAIGSIIAGIVMMSQAEDIDEILFISGILTIFLGPIIVFISSWVLYAFGQFVDDIHAMRDKKGTTEEVENEAMEKAQHDAEEKTKRKAEEAKRKAEEAERKTAGKAKHKAEEAEHKTVEKATAAAESGHSTLCKCGQRFYGTVCHFCGRTLNDL